MLAGEEASVQWSVTSKNLYFSVCYSQAERHLYRQVYSAFVIPS